jgi:rhamnosyltransferase
MAAVQNESGLAPRVCAVVVAFHPDAELEARLRELLPQVAALVVVDNTPAAARHGSVVLPAAGAARVCLIENAENLGVGAALNQGLAQAAQWNCDWLLTLDQDSRWYPDMVQTLTRVAASCMPKPAVIGGNHLDPRTGRTKAPAAEVGFLEQKTVITSGSLVEVRAAQAVGGFRADYFIDQLDHEFCLRVRAHGGRVVISRKPVMAHSVGEDGGAWLPLVGRLPSHAPLRKYYVARNSLVTIGKYWRNEPGWCLRRALRLLLGLLLMITLERQRLSKARAFVAGLVDAMVGRMGASRRQWLFSE